MRRLGLATIAVAAGLVAASGVGSQAATPTPDPKLLFRASRVQLIGPSAPLNVAKDSAPLTATVRDWNNKPQPNITVTFRVLTGPDAGYSQTGVTTTPDGKASPKIALTDKTKPGTDVVQATYADGLEIHKSERVFVGWHAGAPARSIASDATLSVSPSCFQPASAAKLTSNEFRLLKPFPGSASATPSAEQGTITVTGDEFNPFSAVLITFDAGPGGHPQNFAAGTDGFGHFSRDIQVTEPAEGSHLVRADDFRQREADTTYTLPCMMPSLALYPPIGPPGFVAIAVGTGFPGGSSISLLNWIRPGIPSPLPANIHVNPDGTFEYPVLVLYHDILGPRLLRAVVANPNGPNAGAAIEADAPFLVTPGRSQPPDFVLRR